MIYIGVLVLIYLLTFLLCYKKKVTYTSKLLFILASSFILGLIMGLRDITVGIDTSTYYQYYNIINTYEWGEILSSLKIYSVEFGFALLMKLIGSLGGNYYIFQIIVSVTMCLLIGKFILENSKNVFLSIILYYTSGLYFYGYNISRQMLAVAIVCNAWSELKKNNILRSFFYFLGGCCIHFSMVVFLVVYIIYFLKRYKVIQQIMSILLILLTFTFSYWQYNFINYIGNYLDIYSNYLSSDGGLVVGYIKVIWIMIITISLYVIITNKNYYDYETKCLAFFSLLNSLFWFAGTELKYLERVGLVFAPFVIVFLTNILHDTTNNKVRYLGISLTIFVYTIIFLNSINGQYAYASFL